MPLYRPVCTALVSQPMPNSLVGSTPSDVHTISEVVPFLVAHVA